MTENEIPGTTPLTNRQAEIRKIVDEELVAQFAEEDRHGSARWLAPWYRHDMCKCGWEAPRTSRNRAVSVGVHAAAAKKKARKTASANIEARMAATRTLTR